MKYPGTKKTQELSSENTEELSSKSGELTFTQIGAKIGARGVRLDENFFKE